MAKRYRSLRRSTGKRRYKRLFIIASEGEKTEPEYFRRFGGPESAVTVKCIKAASPSPDKVLERGCASSFKSSPCVLETKHGL